MGPGWEGEGGWGWGGDEESLGGVQRGRGVESKELEVCLAGWVERQHHCTYEGVEGSEER